MAGAGASLMETILDMEGVGASIVEFVNDVAARRVCRKFRVRSNQTNFGQTMRENMEIMNQQMHSKFSVLSSFCK